VNHIRGEKVILDSDVAALYGVETRDINKIKHSSADLKAFTEKGLYMLATIIKSPKAVQTTLDIIETYARIKDLSRSISKLPKANEAEQKNILEKAAEVIGDMVFC
jgi:hypothetical protein